MAPVAMRRGLPNVRRKGLVRVAPVAMRRGLPDAQVRVIAHVAK